MPLWGYSLHADFGLIIPLNFFMVLGNRRNGFDLKFFGGRGSGRLTALFNLPYYRTQISFVVVAINWCF